MRRGRRDDDGGAGTGTGPGGDQQDTARYGAQYGPPPQPDGQPGGRPGPAYGTYGQPLFGRPGYGQPGYGNNPYPPPESYGAGPAGASGPARGRPGLIVAIAFLVQLVVVAAVGNKWSTDRALDFQRDHEGLPGQFATLPQVLSWRFTPPYDGATQLWLGALFGLLALFVVSALVSLALVRGPITFWRAFVAVWAATLVGVLAGGMVRRGVQDQFGRYGTARAVLFFSGGSEIPTGLVLGLLAGLIAAIVAVVSRRPAVVALPPPPPAPEHGPDPEAPTPWYGDDAGPAAQPYGTSPSMQKVQQSVGPGAQPDSQTQAFGTKRLPDVPPPSSSAPSSSAPSSSAPAPDSPRGTDAQATTQFPAAGAADRRPETPEGAETPDRPDRSGEATQAVPVTPPPAVDRPAEAAAQRPAGADEPTSVRRPEGFPPPAPAQAPAPEGQSTQRFPRPPDDEELGHHPD